MNKLFLIALIFFSCTTSHKLRAKKFKASSGSLSSSQLLYRDYYCHFRKEVDPKSQCESELLTVDAELFRDNLETLEAHTNRLLKFRPENFYNRSIDTKAKNRKPSYDKEPITIVLATGLFSELSSITPFYNILDDSKDSIYRRQVLSKLKNSSLKEKVYSIKEMKVVDSSLDKLFKFGSIDHNGKSLINIIYLRPQMGSFETFGDFRKNKELYISRLNKFFSITQIPNRLYLAGHSRGSLVMLDLLSFVDRQKVKPKWYVKLKGMISFNGAIWGSSYAENLIYDKNTSMLDLKNLLEHTSQLDTRANLESSLKNRDTMITIAKDGALSVIDSLNKTKNESPPITIPTPQSAWASWKTIESTLDLGNRYLDYEGYISRFKLIGQNALLSIDDLSYKKRKKWFETHTIPSHISYYSFSSIMASPVLKEENYDKSEFAMINQPNMGRNTSEYGFLRSSYYYNHEANKNKLQDGLIGLQESTFHPSLHMHLNKNQRAYKAIELGVFATHHTGLVHNSLIDVDEDSFNPLDRDSMLKSLRVVLDIYEKK